MDGGTNRFKHAIVVVGMNTADISEEYLRDSRILFLGSAESWKLKQQKNAQVIIRSAGIARKYRPMIEYDIKELRKANPLRTFTLDTVEKLRVVIADELKTLDELPTEAVASLEIVPEEATATSEAAPPVPAKKPSRTRAQIVRDVFEETQGDLDRTWNKVAAEYPGTNRNSLSAMIYQARAWFRTNDPKLLQRVDAAKSNKNGHSKNHNYAELVPVHVPHVESVSVVESGLSPNLELSKSLQVIYDLFIDAIEALPPLIKAVQAHEEKLKALEARAARVFQATREMQDAVTNLN